MNSSFYRLFLTPAPYRKLLFFLGSLFMVTFPMTKEISGMTTAQNKKPLFINEYAAFVNQYETRKKFNSLSSIELLKKLEQHPDRLSVCEELSGPIGATFFMIFTVFTSSTYVERMLKLFDQPECQPAFSLFLKNYATEKVPLKKKRQIGKQRLEKTEDASRIPNDNPSLYQELKQQPISSDSAQLITAAFEKCNLEAPYMLVEKTQVSEKMSVRKRRQVGQKAFEESQKIIAEHASRMPFNNVSTPKDENSTLHRFTTTTSITQKPIALEINVFSEASVNSCSFGDKMPALFDSPKKVNSSRSHEDEEFLSTDEIVALFATFNSPIKSAKNDADTHRVENANNLTNNSSVDTEGIVFEEEYLDDDSSSEDESTADESKVSLLPRRLFNQPE